MKGDLDHPNAISILVEAIGKALKKKIVSPALRSFAEQIAVDWRSEELPEAPLEDFASVFAEVWRSAEGTGSAQPHLRLEPCKVRGGRELKLDVLAITQEDKPFLVDSVMGELAEAGLEVRAMFHPVVPLDGRETSIIIVILAPVGEDRRGALIGELEATLEDVRLAVADFPAITALLERTAQDLAAAAASPETREGLAFLEWLTADRFVFLGARTYTYPRTQDGAYLAEEPSFLPEDGLGILRDPARRVLHRAAEPAVLAAQLLTPLERGASIAVAKATLRSRVQRRAHLDYVAVKRYAPDGAAAGEVRFVGLFTLDAYEARADETPLIRVKVAHVLSRLGVNPSAHTAKRLRNILETYPRDELFQIDEATLYETAMGVLHLYDRPRVRLFPRMDAFDRFVSVLLYLPRERYTSAVHEAAAKVVAEAWGGVVQESQASYASEPLARVHMIVNVTPGAHADPEIPALEARISEVVRTWGDRFESLIRNGAAPLGKVAEVLARYAGAFPAGYRERYSAAEAVVDLGVIEALGAERPLAIRAYRLTEDGPRRFRFKLYRHGGAVPLAEVLPILENMGLKAMTEDGFPLRRRGAAGAVDTVWVHEFELEDERGDTLVFAEVREPFEEAFTAVWEGRAENDGFNRLVLELGVSWREAALMRALARYRQQSGLDPSQAVQAASLQAYPGIARLVLDLLMIKFNPAIQADREERARQAETLFADILEALQSVESLDADRVLRRLAFLAKAITRTNFYQRGPDGRAKPYISFKIASRDLADLPEPKPYREIFVCSPVVEGVHLRFGPVARGGLRWSDRRDDFRTEVLGLVKAQQVKNAVIVPVGAKGGFYPKAGVRGDSPDEVRAAAVEAYKVFLCGLLDITDNLDARGRAVRPDAVIAHESDDPYLVVAADKGTATFSDIANGVAEAYGFWLGDAFASGGSAGYDHKAMGITARGAWEAVKRHFRELGKDIQSEPFTCIGVGDMSGDVFGNGALLSTQMRLIAAFDHRHIFIDPDPDAARAFAERKRLFALPRSSWDDYDRTAISPGGGVFARSGKVIALTPEIRARLRLDDVEATPVDLIRAILRAEAELLYLGGIGTYVKGPLETHAEVGDKANDAVRVDASELRVKVVGEGANLGFTQAGRIAFARLGGRIDTDAIDNSAGVDTSDHEVNIKILARQAERAGQLKAADRDALLFSMTEEVGDHVLAHNYAQTLALSLQEAQALADLDAHGRFMMGLEAQGRLDRKVEGLPRAAAVADLKAAGRGLTRPELAVITAYGKLELSAEILAGSAPDDPYFERALVGYFPSAMARFEGEMKRHRLRREIIATVIANTIVDRVGPTFPDRLRAATGASTTMLVTAFETARQTLRLDEAWRSIDHLDLKAPWTAQRALYQEAADVTRGLTFFLTRNALGEAARVQKLIDAFQPGADLLTSEGFAILSPFERDAAKARAKGFMDHGAPRDVAECVALLRPLAAVADISSLAKAARWDILSAARLYYSVGSAFGFDRLRTAAAAIPGRDAYERKAVRELLLELLSEQAGRTRAVMALSKRPVEDPSPLIAAWSQPRRAAVDRARAVIADIEGAAEGWSFAKLTLANAAIRSCAALERA